MTDDTQFVTFDCGHGLTLSDLADNNCPLCKLSSFREAINRLYENRDNGQIADFIEIEYGLLNGD